MDDPVVKTATIIPNMGVKEKTIIVLTVPILLRPLRKSNRAYPNPNTDMKIICGQSVIGNAKST
jgi:hypothetical protein